MALSLFAIGRWRRHNRTQAHAFAVAAEQPDFARVEDVGNIVAPLEEKATLRIDEYGASNLAVRGNIHDSNASLRARTAFSARG